MIFRCSWLKSNHGSHFYRPIDEDYFAGAYHAQVRELAEHSVTNYKQLA